MGCSLETLWLCDAWSCAWALLGLGLLQSYKPKKYSVHFFGMFRVYEGKVQVEMQHSDRTLEAFAPWNTSGFIADGHCHRSLRDLSM